MDIESGDTVWSLPFDSPSGMVRLTNGGLAVASMHGNHVVLFDRHLRLADIIAHPLMNDLHGLSRRGDRILIACSGTDSIIEIDGCGKHTWGWRARNDTSVDTLPARDSTNPLFFDRRFHKSTTEHQLTHVNQAVYDPNDQDSIIAVLFKQGQLVRIGMRDGSLDVLLDGLTEPHALRPIDKGWTIADSGADKVVVLDDNFSICSEIDLAFDWVQDCVPLTGSRFLIADANNSRFVVWDRVGESVLVETSYPAEWKVYQVEPIDAVADAAFMRVELNGART